MFKIETLRADEDAITLNMSENLFHEALQHKLESKARFHVKMASGEDFDIVYWDNDEDIEPRDTYPSYFKRPYMTKYLTYDENDKSTLYLDFFRAEKYGVRGTERIYDSDQQGGSEFYGNGNMVR